MIDLAPPPRSLTPRDGAAPSVDDDATAFAAELAETLRSRFRVICVATIVVWCVSLLFVDRLTLPINVALTVRGVECLTVGLSLVWLSRPRTLRQMERWAIACWGLLVAMSAYGLLYVPVDKLPVKVASVLVAIYVVCLVSGLTLRPTAFIGVSSIAMLSVLELRGARALLVSSLTIVGSAQVFLVVFSIVRERTARSEHSARRALARANARLAADDETRRRLFVNLSHDFRTPLAVIRAEAEAVRARAAAEQLPSVQRIEGNARALTDLTDQLLELARLEVGRMPHAPEPVDVLAIAREQAALVPASNGRSAELDVEQGEPWVALVDPSHLRRILGNLLSNARRHGGDDVAMHFRDAGERLRIAISDGGPGLAAAARATLFVRFASHSREGGTSTGIGLPLARELAELNGGTLTFDADAPRTTFVLELPRTDCAPSVSSAERAPRTPSESPPSTDPPREGQATGAADRPRLLLVEDNSDLQQVLRNLLSVDYRVTVTGSVGQAEAALAAGVFDVLLCDRMLPDGEGFDVIAAVRASAVHESTPVVILSALGEPAERTAGLTMGADDYVSKPFDAAELRARIAVARARASERRAALAEQRRALLMEVHDGVSASLARASMALSRGDSEVARARAQTSIADGIREVSEIMSLLGATAEPWTALVADVRRSIESAAESSSMALTLEASDDPIPLPVPAPVAHVIRRVVRECLTNAIKHASAKHARVTMVARDDAYVVRIEDDGVGFASASENVEAGGRGLRFMRSRLLRIGGSLRIESLAPGARVEASIPRRRIEDFAAFGA